MNTTRAARIAKSIVTAIAIGLMCAPAWAQERGRGGEKRGGGGRGGGEVRSRGESRGGARIRQEGRKAEVRSRQESRGDTRVGERSRDQTRSKGEARVRGEDREQRREAVTGTDTARSRTREGTALGARARDRKEVMLTDDGDGRRHRGRGRDRDWDDDRFAFGFGFGVGPFQGFYGRPWYSWYGPRWGGWYGPTFGYFGPWSGYYGYGWPYYAGDTYIGGNTYVGSAYYDPEAIEEEAAGRRESSTTEEAKGFQRRAEIAFREGRYDEAVRLANHAVVEMPNDGRLFLFLSQALFAVGDYGAAAGAAHHAMSASDEDDWGYVVENFQRYYGNGNDYTDQLRRLEKFTRENPDAPYARFLLGYHYGFLGHPKEARAELAEAAKLEGRDELAGELLVRFGGERPSRRSGEGMAEQDRDDDREIRQ